MILKLVMVLDSKAKNFIQPLFVREVEEAVRAFGNALNNPESQFFNFAEDFVLCEMGSVDDESGLLTTLKTPRTIISGIDASNQHRLHYASHAINMDTAA